MNSLIKELNNAAHAIRSNPNISVEELTEKSNNNLETNIVSKELTEKSNDNSETIIVSEESVEKSNDNSETTIVSEEIETIDNITESNEKNRNEVIKTILDTIQDLDDIKNKLNDDEYLKIANKLQFIYNKCKYITNFDRENDYWSTDDDYVVETDSDDDHLVEEYQPPLPYICNCTYENFGKETFACYGNRKCFSVTEYMQCNRYKMLSTFIPDLKYFFCNFDKNIILEEGSHFIPYTYDTLIKFDINYINDLYFKMNEFGFPKEIENNNKLFFSKIIQEYLNTIDLFYRNQKARYSIYCLNFTVNILKYFTVNTLKFANTFNNKLSEFLNNEIFVSVYEEEFNGKDNNFVQDWIKYVKFFIEENSNSV